jgi:hypothetical protein
MTHIDHDGEAGTLRAEIEVVFESLRDLAAAKGTPVLNRMVGYSYGYAQAMLKKGDLLEAGKQLNWLKTELINQAQKAGEGTGTGVPYVGGPFDGGTDPTGFSDSIDIRRGGSKESGRYVLTEKDGGRVYMWEPEQA